MKLSIFTTVTDPVKRGDNYDDAMACYKELADEVVIIDGNCTGEVHLPNYKQIDSNWPKEFSWDFIGQQFQRGYEAATGDWVIHADLDFVFHEDDFKKIRAAMLSNPDAPGLTFYKWQFVLPDRFNLKSRLVLAVNKGKYGDRIRFDSGGDLCQPSLDGEEIKPDSVPEAKVPFYNYEKMTKTLPQVQDDVERMARAWERYFGEPKLGTDETAFSKWLVMMEGRFAKPQQRIKLPAHPKYVQETIANLKPEQFGYDGFGVFDENDYVRGLHA